MFFCSSLNPGALITQSSAAGVAIISTDTCWCKSSAWLIDLFVFGKMFKFLRFCFYGSFLEQIDLFVFFQLNVLLTLACVNGPLI